MRRAGRQRREGAGLRAVGSVSEFGQAQEGDKANGHGFTGLRPRSVCEAPTRLHEHGPGGSLGDDIHDTARDGVPIEYRAGYKS